MSEIKKDVLHPDGQQGVDIYPKTSIDQVEQLEEILQRISQKSGVGIVSITKTGTDGLVDTYTILFTDGSITTYTVTNGGVSSVNGKMGEVELNAEDGEGTYSIKNKEELSRINQTYGRANAAFGHKNKTYQRDTFTFGGNNKVGLTFEEWLEQNPNGNQEQYEASYSFAFAQGETNRVEGRDSAAFGASNTILSMQSFALGQLNYIDKDSDKSTTIGEVNNLQKSKRAKVIGSNNTANNIEDCSIIGRNNSMGTTNNPTSDSVLIGYNLKNYYHNKIVLGHHNDNKPDTLIEFGNGNSGEDSNAFEVLINGEIRIPNFDSMGVKKGMIRIKCVNGELKIF